MQFLRILRLATLISFPLIFYSIIILWLYILFFVYSDGYTITGRVKIQSMFFFSFTYKKKLNLIAV